MVVVAMGTNVCDDITTDVEALFVLTVPDTV